MLSFRGSLSFSQDRTTLPVGGGGLLGAGGTGPLSPARKRDQKLVTTTGTLGSGEAVGQDPTLQITPELVLYVGGHPIAHGVGLGSLGQGVLEVFLDDTVETGGLRLSATVGLGVRAARCSRTVRVELRSLRDAQSSSALLRIRLAEKAENRKQMPVKLAPPVANACQEEPPGGSGGSFCRTWLSVRTSTRSSNTS